MIKSKFKNLILVFLALVCLLPFATVSASAKDDHVYPCYCDECIQLWNKKFNEFYPNNYFSGFTTSIPSELNGKDLLILHRTYSDGSKGIYLYFYDDYSISGTSISLNNCYLHMASTFTSGYSYDFTFSSYILNVRFTGSSESDFYSYETDWPKEIKVKALYTTINNDYWVESDEFNYFLCSSFEYPNSHLSDTDIFKEEFPGFLKTAWSSIHDFIFANDLVLIVFAIALAGSIVAIVKRASR